MFLKKLLFLFLLFQLCTNTLWSSNLISSQIQVDFSIPYTEAYTPNSVIVPFTSIGGLIILKGRVNSDEGNFILDTGANGLVLNDFYFTPDRSLASERGVGLSGKTSVLGALAVDSFHFDQLTFPNTAAQTINLQHLENRKRTKILGLIGYDILKDFEIMIDYRRRILTFSKTDKFGNIMTTLPHTINKVDSFLFKLGNHIPVITLKVQGKTKRMGIDTGAEYNLLNIRRSKNIMSNFKILKTIEINTTGKPVDALAGKLYRVALKEKYKCGGMSTVLINFRHLENIYNTKLDGILGYEFLAPWLFSINYKKQKLFLHKLEYIRP